MALIRLWHGYGWHSPQQTRKMQWARQGCCGVGTELVRNSLSPGQELSGGVGGCLAERSSVLQLIGLYLNLAHIRSCLSLRGLRYLKRCARKLYTCKLVKHWDFVCLVEFKINKWILVLFVLCGLADVVYGYRHIHQLLILQKQSLYFYSSIQVTAGDIKWSIF